MVVASLLIVPSGCVDETRGATGHGLTVGQKMGRSVSSTVTAVRQSPSWPRFQVHDCSAGIAPRLLSPLSLIPSLA